MLSRAPFSGMRWCHPLLAVLIGSFLLPLASLAAGGTSARLLLPESAVPPGDSFTVGVELTMKPGWHTYWRNGGDSGAPTTLDWKLPPGFTAGPPRWPAPERFAEEDTVTYVYHGTAVLLVPIQVAPNTPNGPAELSVKVDWLECEKSCIPGGTTLRGNIRIGATRGPVPTTEALRNAEENLPKPLPPGAADASWDGPDNTDTRTLILQWRPASTVRNPDFFPDTPAPADKTSFEVLTATERMPGPNGSVLIRKKVKRYTDAGATPAPWPTRVTGLLAGLDPKQRAHPAFEANLPIAEPQAAQAAGSRSSPGNPSRSDSGATNVRTETTSPPASAGPVVPRLSLPRALALAVLGGLILNIMPCVLPVIALKILGFVRQSGSRPAEIRKLGFIYGFGVWFSFLVLAGVVIAVQKASGAASWGMQFGNPVFLVAMTSLVLLVSLSLFGVFEINVGGRALDAAGDLASKEGPAGAFFNGMLAVALATPCTAPFLAPALGYAFTAPNSLTVVAIFSAVAFGLALPYVVLSCQPAWLRYLPKPGAWMEHFKVAMGFPMLATALWLYTLAADRFGDSGPLWLGLFLVCLALATWIWGEFAQRGRRRPAVAIALSLVIAGSAYGYALERQLDWRHPSSAPSTADAPLPAGANEIPWQPWSRAAVDAAREAGRPVFVDFTAKWCLTCKLNENSSIAIPSVREKLRAINAVSLKGDHTRTPPEITEELKRFGRAGVPLVLVYPRDKSREPLVLPEVLTPGIVLDALEKAAL